MRWRNVWRALQIGAPAVARTASMARSAWALIALGLAFGGTLLGQWLLRDPLTGAGVGLLFFLAAIAAAFGSAALRLLDERDRAETSQLLLEYDADDQSCHQEDWVDPGHQLAAERHRVRVTNASAKTIDAVTLSLDRFSPQGASFLPMPLKVVGDDMGIRSIDVALHGRERRYYEVALASFDSAGRIGEIVLAYARSGVPNMISSARRYELELRAQGRDTPAAVARFEVWVEDRRLKFAAAGDDATSVRAGLKRERDKRFADLLTARRELAIDILNRPTNTPQFLSTWQESSAAWKLNVLTLMREHRCTPQEIASLEHLGTVPIGAFDTDPSINLLKSVHAEAIKRLERIIDRFSDRPVFGA